MEFLYDKFHIDVVCIFGYYYFMKIYLEFIFKDAHNWKNHVFMSVCLISMKFSFEM
jgi:hypothetical protein